MNRRDFMRGASMCAVAAAMPMPDALADAPETYRLLMGGIPLADALKADTFGPIFDGVVGVYNGVIIRKVEYIESLPEGGRVLIRNIPAVEFYDGR